LSDVMSSDLPWEEIGSLLELRGLAGRPYLYLGMNARHFVVPEPGVRSQWIRRQLAARLGTDVWDWAVDPGEANLRETMRRLRRVRL
jgi:hypothetical protein